jgi:glutathione S-transferase
MLQEKCSVAEDLLGEKEWFLERFTLADAFFFWCFRRATQFEVHLSPFAKCRVHFDVFHDEKVCVNC